MNRADLQRLADLRIEEARVLLRANKYSGAYYLAGYAVECGLKACIAKQIRRHTYPDKQLAQKCCTHNLDELVVLAGLRSDLNANPDVLRHWPVVKDWNEQSRYDRKNRVEALALYDAITDATHGVLPWIKTHW